MNLRDTLRKTANLFVDVDPSTSADSFSPMDDIAAEARSKATRSVADVVKAAPGPDLDQVKVPEAAASNGPTVGADGTPNFPEIFRQAGVPAVAFGADEALSVITSLPSDLPIEVRRKTVGATLTAMGKSMGVSTDSVVADASRKVAALVSFEEYLTTQTNAYSGMVQAKIAELQAQITEQEKLLSAAKANLENAIAKCEAEGDRLDDVLEFFTLDVGASRNA